MMAKIMSLFILGITNWCKEGKSVTGASGLLERVDTPGFAGAFFYAVKRYFGLEISL
jgi:phosphatidate cytidylyltransferase